MALTKVAAIKAFFGDVRPVSNQELIELRKAAPEAFDELAAGALTALGQEVKAA